MENEAAPTGGRLASPEVIGGKSNRHSGEKGAPQAPFFHALFWGDGGRKGCCGVFWAKGRCGRLFFMPFFGWWRAEGVRRGGVVCRGGRAVVTGLAGAGMVFGRAAGGAAAFARRFLLFGGQSRRFLGGGHLFWGKELCGEAVRGAPCRKSGAARLAFSPAAAPVRARRRGKKPNAPRRFCGTALPARLPRTIPSPKKDDRPQENGGSVPQTTKNGARTPRLHPPPARTPFPLLPIPSPRHAPRGKPRPPAAPLPPATTRKRA